MAQETGRQTDPEKGNTTQDVATGIIPVLLPGMAS